MPHDADLPVSRPQTTYVVEHLRTGFIENGAGAGSRLPSIRRLTRELAVGRNTVIEAYEHLVAEGLVHSRPGAGFFVAERARSGQEDTIPVSLADVTSENWRLFEQDDTRLKLGCGWLPDDWREIDDLAHAIRSVTRQSRAGVFDYSPPLGTPALRTLIQQRLRRLGIETHANQILLTGGGSHALDLLVRLLIRPGDTVLVESPGYYNLLGLLRLQRANIIAVPRRADGPDIERLEALLLEHRPSLMFINSVFQNPTGTSLSAPIAHRLLRLAERHDVRIIEDDIYADFQNTPSVRLSELDGLDRVIYVGSFSKSLSCSLRVGFISGQPELIRRLVDVKMLTSISAPHFAEQVLATMLQNGSYRRMMERLRVRLARQMSATLALLRKAGWQIFDAPAGGLFVWTRHPDIESSQRLVAHAATRGIALSPGRVFLPEARDTPWLRINVAYATDARARRFLADPANDRA
ncbi:PLP-dependent aminotransferase family protein [Modicisalibacter coralii]|uniref:aminotransferase-like domain-containing protein n=1 Tax=Modicisalibacter coralii TaxID=2304602 RepID=UPI00100C0EAC|nr:PLP-dependent aminotransferase family protein [Halomonas coralii]